ncbi:DUF4240 domain-containing protein [Amycolatopsis alba]|nr:DUF4240 domain-containing protein [Amycolatopsis alba]
MDTHQFWTLIEGARGQVSDSADGEAVADRASVLLAGPPPT